MSPTEAQKTTKDSSVSVTYRTAIDPSGQVGSLYDGYRDRIVEALDASHFGNSCLLRETRRCEIVHDTNDHNPYFLQMVSIDDESRLSLLLNLREKKGLATIDDCFIPITKYTRLFCYTYIQRVEKLPDDGKDIQKTISRLKSQKQATHIITEIEWGTDVAVVLELPSAPDTVTEIDRVLERICTFLLCDTNTLPLDADEKNILNKIIHTKVFSNINEIKYFTQLYDVCTNIQQNKNQTADFPVSYGLQLVTRLYPYYTGQGVTFVPLTTELRQSVQLYLLDIISSTKKSMSVTREYLPKQLSGHLPRELSMAQKQCSDVQDQCMREVERLSKLVVGVRRGLFKMSQVDEALRDSEQLMMRKTISNITQILNDMTEKGHFISDLDKQHFRYVNVADYGIDEADNEKTIERRLIADVEYDRILCSRDTLNKNDPDRLRRLRSDLVKELHNNSNLRLTYADFSYSSHKLQHMMRLPSNMSDIENNKPLQAKTSSMKEIQHSPISSTKTHPSYHPPTQMQTLVPTSTKLPITDAAVIRTQINPSLPIQSKTSAPATKENETPVLTIPKQQTYATPQPNLQTSGLSHTKTQTQIPAFIKLPITDTTDTRIRVNTLSSAQSTTSFVVVQENAASLATMEKPKITILPTSKPPTNASTQAELQTSSPPPTNRQTVLQPSSSFTESPILVSAPSETHTARSSLPDNSVINILLLGETGVGKSTFINAFANYLTFNTMEQAEKDRPVVLIPVSFLITVGDNFDEYVVKFGSVDDINNEDFEHPGQSVTQRCRSYVFNLSPNHKQKLCIIDTPGFGDTRGLQQDDRNIQHILEYIQKLSHLNAVCFLLKPNESRLNIFFRSCLDQLFSLLGPNIAQNILFCFTNCRSTFYTPGNTAPLLKKMLVSLSKIDVPFKKDNTFCFDSESFRYLVALRDGIRFSGLERNEYEVSWIKSVAEADRLVRYIRTALNPFRVSDKR